MSVGTTAAAPRVHAGIEFFSIQIGSCADGHVFVEINATCCDEEELVQIELGNHRVASFERAFELIRHTIEPVQ